MSCTVPVGGNDSIETENIAIKTVNNFDNREVSYKNS